MLGHLPASTLNVLQKCPSYHVNDKGALSFRCIHANCCGFGQEIELASLRTFPFQTSGPLDHDLQILVNSLWL
jgi:hypothetical protein